MARTTKATTRRRGVPAIRESAQNIWLAGVGALSLAEERGEKAVKLAGVEGEKLFRTLVRKGSAYQSRNKARVRDVLGRVDAVREQTVGRVESRLDRGMGAALRGLGIPTRSEIAQLTRRVEELTRAVGATRGAGGKRSTRRKAAAAR